VITYHFLLARKHGETEGFPLLASFSETLPLTRRYEELTGPNCAEFAKDHAELMFVSDGMVLAHHDFPDPADLEKSRLVKVLAEARALDAENRRAQQELAAAERRAAAAKSAVKTLSPEQKELLRKEREAEEARVKEAAEALEKAEREAREKREADQRLADEERVRQDALVARSTFRSEIAGLGEAEVRLMAEQSGLKPEISATRDELIEALVVAAGYPPAEQTLL
jgi:hypothetical protein